MRQRTLALLPLIFATMALASAAHSNTLPNTLSDEVCVSEVRDDVASLPGMAPELRVVCNNTRVGAMFTFPTSAPSLTEKSPVLALALSSTPQGALFSQRMNCSRFQLIQTGSDKTAVIACRLTNGGWPHVITLSIRDNLLRLAEGPPTAISALVELVSPGQPGKPKSEWTDALRLAFGEAIPLVSPRELSLFSELVRGAHAANAQGKHSESERLLRQALDLQTKLLGEQNPATADTIMDLALSLSNRGRGEEAEALFTRADAIIQKSPKDSDRARLFTYYGFHSANQGKYAEAFTAAQNAVQAWRKQLAGPQLALANTLVTVPEDFSPDHLERGELGLALNLLANMALKLEDLASANAAATEALGIFTDTKGIPQWWRADALLTLGKISSAQGRLSAAETYLNTALQQRRLLKGDGPHTIEVLSALGAAYQREGLLTSSIITYRELFNLLKTLPDATQDAIRVEDLIPYGLAVTGYAKNLSDEQQIQGLFSEAFDAFKLVRPTNVEQAIEQTATRLASTNPEIRALLDDISQVRRRRDTANTELSYETSLPDDQRSRIAEDRLTEEKKRAEAELNRLNGLLEKRFPQYEALLKPQPLSLLEVRQRLGEREGLVAFLVGRQQSFVTLIRRDGIFIGSVNEGEQSLTSTVASLRRALEIQAGSVNDYDLDRAHQLYETLFGQVDNKLKDLDHLIIAPSGPLASLPFSILVTRPVATAKYSQASWLITRAAISHVPSLQAFYTLRTVARASPPSRKILALGNPLLSGKSTGSATNASASALATSCRPAGPAPAALVSSLAPLPDTELEVRSVAQAVGATAADTLLLAKDASEQALRSKSLADYRILYFATHGLLPGELKCQAEPALVLTPPQQSVERNNDGLLEASEVAALKINADLVVLSACNTAGAAGRFGGDALSGLAESFFYAGARNLLVSHWQVPSAATSQLMSQVFGMIGPDLEKGASAALQGAQKIMIAQEKTAHPFFWGAFVLVGDGSASESLPIPRSVSGNTAAAPQPTGGRL